MTTGLLAASFAATCGSEPTDGATPFGGRHGTRLKISPARVATAFTFSITLPGRPVFAGVAAATSDEDKAGVAVAMGAVCATALDAAKPSSMSTIAAGPAALERRSRAFINAGS